MNFRLSFAGLLIVLAVLPTNLTAESRFLDDFPQGLGVNLGPSAGMGLSYRSMNSHQGWQTTGIVLRDPTGNSDWVYLSLGAGYLHPLGDFSLSPWLNAIPYLQASTAFTGSTPLDGKITNIAGGLVGGLSYGIEWLFWGHFSLNVEIAQSVGAQLSTGRQKAWDPQLIALVFPQVAVYFRY